MGPDVGLLDLFDKRHQKAAGAQRPDSVSTEPEQSAPAQRTADGPVRAERTVYVSCPDDNNPIGGVRMLYRHVDVLNSMGIPASILHFGPDFRCTWFENTTPVTDASVTTPSASDIVVLPEVYGPDLAELFPGSRKVVFNQNCYYTFEGYTWDTELTVSPYRHPEVVGAIVVSDDSARYLEYAFPGLAVERMHYAIKPELFYLGDEKLPRISFMPRKHPEDATQVLSILRSRGALDGIEVVAIDGVSEATAAETLRSSLAFLSFGYPEGFSLPPAEAMACGCAVIGYHGMGAREFFDPAYSRPIEIHDIVGFAAAVEDVLDGWRSDPESITRMGQAASRNILGTYTVECERADIRRAWERFLGPTATPGA